MAAHLSHHAADRASQRLGLGSASAEKLAQAALERGLSVEDVAGRLKRWMQHVETQHPGRRLRIHGTHVYVFGRDQTVVTILHLPREHQRAALRRQASHH